ncbi:hypothetical protein K2173_019221 [Erythroxylum novogranatense]|uniref:RING-type E3 ubiquitin transferase n=1 Tax=Erythroxylum novogranatense TaxID=1862640 RepID=A0AAV8STN9_9ROSI|nr:hypothetical protein K2173_019221 [Erythroxylum novogranatense]
MDDRQDQSFAPQICMDVKCSKSELDDDDGESPYSVLFILRPSSGTIDIWHSGTEVRTQLKRDPVQLTVQDLVDSDKSCSTRGLLSSLLSPFLSEFPELVDMLIKNALDQIGEAAQNEDEKCRWTVHVDVLMVRRYCGPQVRAETVRWSDIESLETMIVQEEDRCVMCLGKLKVGWRGTRTPCKHVFHHQCIVQWLTLRYRCPLCRYEMPRPSYMLPRAEASNHEAPQTYETGDYERYSIQETNGLYTPSLWTN